MILLAAIWIESRPRPADSGERAQNAAVNPGNIDPNDLPLLENYDILANFEPLTELPQPVQADDSDDADSNQSM